MEFHYIIVILAIIVILVFQWRIFKSTLNKIKAFRATFLPVQTYEIIQLPLSQISQSDDEDDEMQDVETIAQLSVNSETVSPVLSEIFKSLNSYLRKNKGAVSDFHLMKDVVERNCEVVEEEISIQQPIPLYLGLMGTMIGIIVGIVFIAISGGLNSESLVNNISSLMICVAIAMVASFVGILFTTLLSWKAKDANSTVEVEKNLLYSWLQTELLPTLSGNTVNALFMLQQNLTAFNSTFQTNIKGLGEALSKVGDSSKEQMELLQMIENIDIKRVAQANVAVLKELRDCTSEIDRFNKYLHNVTDYLHEVNDLNQNVNKHLDRTAAIERMGEFFEKEYTQVENRQQYLSHIVAQVDDALKGSIAKLVESSNESVDTFRQVSTRNYDAMLSHYNELKQQFNDELNHEHQEFVCRISETGKILAEINKIAEVKDIMSNVLISSQRQSDLIMELNKTMKELACSHNSAKVIHHEPEVVMAKPMEFPKSVKLMLGLILTFVIIACAMYAFSTINDIVNPPQVFQVVDIPVDEQFAPLEQSSISIESDQESKVERDTSATDLITEPIPEQDSDEATSSKLDRVPNSTQKFII